jgi:paraquat-inducible protein A
MVDIYVGAMLVGLVQFKAFASIVPGPGAVYFAAVVVLTMLASSSFDPRLMWDAAEEQRA